MILSLKKIFFSYVDHLQRNECIEKCFGHLSLVIMQGKLQKYTHSLKCLFHDNERHQYMIICIINQIPKINKLMKELRSV